MCANMCPRSLSVGGADPPQSITSDEQMCIVYSRMRLHKRCRFCS